MEDQAPARVRGQRRGALCAAGSLQEGARHHSCDMRICMNRNIFQHQGGCGRVASDMVEVSGIRLIYQASFTATSISWHMPPLQLALTTAAPLSLLHIRSCQESAGAPLLRPLSEELLTFDKLAALPSSSSELPEGNIPIGMPHCQDVAQRAEGQRADCDVISCSGLTKLAHLHCHQCPWHCSRPYGI